MARPKDVQRAFNHFYRANSELRKAVEKFAEIDPLKGHRIEAVRQARALRDEANRAVAELSLEHPGPPPSARPDDE